MAVPYVYPPVNPYVPAVPETFSQRVQRLPDTYLNVAEKGKALLLPEDVQHRAMTAIQDDVFAAAIKSAISPQIINTYGAPPMLPTVNVDPSPEVVPAKLEISGNRKVIVGVTVFLAVVSFILSSLALSIKGQCDNETEWCPDDAAGTAWACWGAVMIIHHVLLIAFSLVSGCSENALRRRNVAIAALVFYCLYIVGVTAGSWWLLYPRILYMKTGLVTASLVVQALAFSLGIFLAIQDIHQYSKSASETTPVFSGYTA